MSGGETEVSKNFKRNPLSAEPLAPGMVPGVGAATVSKLKAKSPHVRTPQQLMGYYLLLNRTEDNFETFLEMRGIKTPYAGIILEAMQAKSLEHCTDDKHDLKSPVKPGADTTNVAQRFITLPLSSHKIVAGQIPGIGKMSLPSVERTIKEEMGEDAKPPKETPSAVQLMGLYLAFGRERERMLRWLIDDCGCLERYAKDTVDALETKACMICDEPTDPGFASPPPTDQRPRLPPTREESEKGIMQGTKNKEKAEALQRVQDQSSALQKLLFHILGGGLIAIIVLHLTIGFV